MRIVAVLAMLTRTETLRIWMYNINIYRDCINMDSKDTQYGHYLAALINSSIIVSIFSLFLESLVFLYICSVWCSEC